MRLDLRDELAIRFQKRLVVMRRKPLRGALKRGEVHAAAPARDVTGHGGVAFGFRAATAQAGKLEALNRFEV